jgi:nucleotide-binding universal stress UspA family protein
MRVLVAVDGSSQSYEATRALSHLAPAKEVIMLHVVDAPRPGYPMMMPEMAQDIYGTVLKHMREDGERLLKRMVAQVPSDAGPVAPRLEIGKPADAIVSVAERERIDLILMGSRGRNALEEILLGSVSHRVVSYASCPVLVITGPMPSLRRMVLAVEGQDDADAAKRTMALKPFKPVTHITVLNVLPFGHCLWPEGTSETEAMRQQSLKCAWAFVWDVAGQLSPFGYQTDGLVGMGSPTTAILQQAAALEADLIAVGSQCGHGLPRCMLGTVPHGVLHRTNRPVLVFK